jgi:Peptide N-acetyl-beta-D-glucosaminyl asparaginase amidase A
MHGFRAMGVFAAIVLVALVVAVPTSAYPTGAAHATPSGARDLASDPTGFPTANYSNPQIEPDPAVPATTPVALNLSAYGTVTLPYGNWETVVMNYTGYTGGTAYDYFQTVTIDGAMVYVGVNPEAGHWTELVNMSEYLAFFDHQPSMTISGPALGAGTNFEGVQDNWLTFLFYPIPAHATGPSYANVVEPLFQFNGDPATATISVPTDASAVVLQMIAIGSEFWYSLNPDFTAVTVAVGGHNVSTYLQYPWINSGGIDLFSWRPIYPVNMLNHQWEYFNLTGALGLLERNSTLTASPASGSLGASVIANLLIYTNPKVTGAKTLSDRFHQAPVETYTVVNTSFNDGNPNGNNYAVYDQTDSVQYGYTTRVTTTTGSYTVTLTTWEQYANFQTLNLVWQNITESETVNTVQTTSYAETGLHGFQVATQSLSYPLAMDLGYTLAYLYSIGSDAYFNYTSYFYNVLQGYQETDSLLSQLNGVWSGSTSTVDQAIERTNGFFASVLEEGPGFAIILNVTSSLHTTTKVYRSTTESWGGARHRDVSTSYFHLLSGVEDNSTTYYVQENITRDVVSSHAWGWSFGAAAGSSPLPGRR